MKESNYLHKGDVVWWKGGWGAEAPKMAEVDGIETYVNRQACLSTPVERASWRQVRSEKTFNCPCGKELESPMVTLTNGHWAYGWQLNPVKMWAKTYEEKM